MSTIVERPARKEVKPSENQAMRTVVTQSTPAEFEMMEAAA